MAPRAPKSLVAEVTSGVDLLELCRRLKITSVFLYGSRAREDSAPSSDYELGIVIDGPARGTRDAFNAAINSTTVRAYTFKRSELLSGVVDTPFPSSFFACELKGTGVILTGDDVLAQMTWPQFNRSDLAEELGFQCGRILAGFQQCRGAGASESLASTAEMVWKCAYYGFRLLALVETGQFIYQRPALLEFGLVRDAAVAEYWLDLETVSGAVRADGGAPLLDLLKFMRRTVAQSFANLESPLTFSREATQYAVYRRD